MPSETSVTADGSESSKVRPESSSSTRYSHTSTRRAQSPFPKRTPLYFAELQQPEVSRTLLSLLLSTSRFRIPVDDVTVNVNSCSVQKVCLVCVQPCTMRFGPQELDPCPRPRTREHLEPLRITCLLSNFSSETSQRLRRSWCATGALTSRSTSNTTDAACP